jgi:hypothetical protein
MIVLAIIHVLARSGMIGNIRWNEYLKVEAGMPHGASHLVMYFTVQLVDGSTMTVEGS